VRKSLYNELGQSINVDLCHSPHYMHICIYIPDIMAV